MRRTIWDLIPVTVVCAALAPACGGDRAVVAPSGDAAGVRSTPPGPVVDVPTSTPAAEPEAGARPPLADAAVADAAAARPPACDALLARFEREEKGASRACATASDCECYAPPEPPCSPMDAARSSSALTLRQIAQEYSEAKCHPLVACAPRLCKRTCRAGRCQNDR